ncbi:HD domain-containing protein [Paractinoplanes atraurantiacus]|uniref:Histidine kinase-, DNA gyrase B-, and HSP90-like ATPase n=1 Tax=Paractinoplanes atraurantiacus TaxID=1036182 RepID=A0A285IS98_9ACTN|nr:ATP-binding protein [Actinoplanes atraurantiacus]SNY50889.1 Histidine kinase-, DNA gyrase B-, and HSP90-like ATPase [Actinoplanes atraurantiacus]
MGDWGPLGDVLRAKASDRDRANVKDLVSYARELLKLVRETFPAYTMHDERHAENVIRLMGRLAAPRLDRMTGLEAALLILAAYFHDAGMAYSPSEIAAIGEEDEFQAFLDGHDEAYVATQRNGGKPPEAVIEQYCRSRHADRARLHLDRCDRRLLQWEGKSIIDQLELICRSHNEPAAALHEPRFRTDFLYQADLRFCAIMLRLADILDLDDTRAPRVIYEHLGLAAHTSPEVATSDREWHKHLASRGFEFPPAPRPNYTLQFSAESADPGDEHHLRAFLKVIEDELLQCRIVADFCDERWRGVPLPAEIDTAGIRGDGYKYGEFRFELDRAAVLELFTGEQLYDDPCAFVRELLQNALDAVRAREHLFGHESSGVRVSCWEDDGGYLWLRVDDDGIGMDEAALRGYFLRVGRSFYQSAEFQAAMTRSGRADRPFGVISRFGIGVLSCFMAGDRVEVTSRPARGGKAVRLSINRRHDYFVVQEQGMTGRPMPGPSGSGPAFPRSPGTSVAVRIDPDQTGLLLGDLLARVPTYLFAPPVPVTLNGRLANEPTERLITEPMLDRAQIADLDAGGTAEPGAELGGLRLAAIPLDLTRDGECDEINGQLLLYTLLKRDREEEGTFFAIGRPHLFEERDMATTHVHVTHYRRGRRRSRTAIALSDLPGGASAAGAAERRTPWGYNGIALPGLSDRQDLLEGGEVSNMLYGYLDLSGELRPDLTVSRSTIRAIPFPVHSAVQLATRRALRKAVAGHADLARAIARDSCVELAGPSPAEPYTVAALRADRLLRDGSWRSERLAEFRGRSADQLRADFRAGKEAMVLLLPPDPRKVNGRPRFPFDDVIAAAVLHFHVDVECVPDVDIAMLTVRSDSAPQHLPGADAFAPMFAVPFSGSARLARASRMMNARHPLTQWLTANAGALAEHFPALFQRVLRVATHLEDVSELNAALDRVVRGGRVPAPPPEAYLRQDKKGWWWSR